MKRFISLILIVLFFAGYFPAKSDAAVAASQGDNRIIVSDAYLQLTVNTENGRFSARTTGGDPIRTTDSNSPILYEFAGKDPETSYASFLIGSDEVIFGNIYRDSEFIQKPSVSGNTITSVWRYKEVYITQTITLIGQNSNTAIDEGNSTVNYSIENRGASGVSIGTRILLDTMVGGNDGCLLRSSLDTSDITGERYFSGANVPQHWFSSDSESNTDIVAYGMLYGWGETAPSSVIFGHWSGLSSTRWAYDIDGWCRYDWGNNKYGSADSAAAIYWNPQTVAAGGSVSHTTTVGMGVRKSLSEGQSFTATVSAPKKVIRGANGQSAFSISIELDNTFENCVDITDNIEVEISIPENARIINENETPQRQYIIGGIKKGQKFTVTWNIAAYSDPGTEGWVFDFEVMTKTVIPVPSQSGRKVDSTTRHSVYVLQMDDFVNNIPSVQFHRVSPSIVYAYDKNMTMMLYGANLFYLADASRARRLYIVHESGKYEADLISITVEDDTTALINLPGALPIGKWELVIEHEYTSARGMFFTITDDMAYQRRGYGTLLFTKTSEWKRDSDYYKQDTDIELDSLHITRFRGTTTPVVPAGHTEVMRITGDIALIDGAEGNLNAVYSVLPDQDEPIYFADKLIKLEGVRGEGGKLLTELIVSSATVDVKDSRGFTVGTKTEVYAKNTGPCKMYLNPNPSMPSGNPMTNMVKLTDQTLVWTQPFNLVLNDMKIYNPRSYGLSEDVSAFLAGLNLAVKEINIRYVKQNGIDQYVADFNGVLDIMSFMEEMYNAVGLPAVQYANKVGFASIRVDQLRVYRDGGVALKVDMAIGIPSFNLGTNTGQQKGYGVEKETTYDILFDQNAMGKGHLIIDTINQIYEITFEAKMSGFVGVNNTTGENSKNDSWFLKGTIGMFQFNVLGTAILMVDELSFDLKGWGAGIPLNPLPFTLTSVNGGVSGLHTIRDTIASGGNPVAGISFRFGISDNFSAPIKGSRMINLKNVGVYIGTDRLQVEGVFSLYNIVSDRGKAALLLYPESGFSHDFIVDIFDSIYAEAGLKVSWDYQKQKFFAGGIVKGWIQFPEFIPILCFQRIAGAEGQINTEFVSAYAEVQIFGYSPAYVGIRYDWGAAAPSFIHPFAASASLDGSGAVPGSPSLYVIDDFSEDGSPVKISFGTNTFSIPVTLSNGAPQLTETATPTSLAPADSQEPQIEPGTPIVDGSGLISGYTTRPASFNDIVGNMSTIYALLGGQEAGTAADPGSGGDAAPIGGDGAGGDGAPVDGTGSGGDAAPIGDTGLVGNPAPIGDIGLAGDTAPIDGDGSGGDGAPADSTGSGGDGVPTDGATPGVDVAQITPAPGGTLKPADNAGTPAMGDPVAIQSTAAVFSTLLPGVVADINSPGTGNILIGCTFTGSTPNITVTKPDSTNYAIRFTGTYPNAQITEVTDSNGNTFYSLMIGVNEVDNMAGLWKVVTDAALNDFAIVGILSTPVLKNITVSDMPGGIKRADMTVSTKAGDNKLTVTLEGVGAADSVFMLVTDEADIEDDGTDRLVASFEMPKDAPSGQYKVNAVISTYNISGDVIMSSVIESALFSYINPRAIPAPDNVDVTVLGSRAIVSWDAIPADRLPDGKLSGYYIVALDGYGNADTAVTPVFAPYTDGTDRYECLVYSWEPGSTLNVSVYGIYEEEPEPSPLPNNTIPARSLMLPGKICEIIWTPKAGCSEYNVRLYNYDAVRGIKTLLADADIDLTPLLDEYGNIKTDNIYGPGYTMVGNLYKYDVIGTRTMYVEDVYDENGDFDGVGILLSNVLPGEDYIVEVRPLPGAEDFRAAITNVSTFGSTSYITFNRVNVPDVKTDAYMIVAVPDTPNADVLYFTFDIPQVLDSNGLPTGNLVSDPSFTVPVDGLDTGIVYTYTVFAIEARAASPDRAIGEYSPPIHITLGAYNPPAFSTEFMAENGIITKEVYDEGGGSTTDYYRTNLPDIDVVVTAGDKTTDILAVCVNGREVERHENLNGVLPNSIRVGLTDGLNTVTVKAENAYMERREIIYHIFVKSGVPALMVDTKVENDTVTLYGATDADAVVTVNEIETPTDENGNFTSFAVFDHATDISFSIQVTDSFQNIVNHIETVANTTVGQITDIKIALRDDVMTVGDNQDLILLAYDSIGNYVILPNSMVAWTADNTVAPPASAASANAAIIGGEELSALNAGVCILTASISLNDNSVISDRTLVQIDPAFLQISEVPYEGGGYNPQIPDTTPSGPSGDDGNDRNTLVPSGGSTRNTTAVTDLVVNDDGSFTLPGGSTVNTPSGKDPVVNSDGSITLPGGGTITLPGSQIIAAPDNTTISSNGTITFPQDKGGTVSTKGGQMIAAPPGTTITAGGRVSFPAGSGGGTISHASGYTFAIREDAIIVLDDREPLGYVILADNPFSDVRAENWFYEFVMFAYNHGLMIGTSPVLFNPNMTTTRAMVVTILYRMEGSPDAGSLTNPFSDVGEGLWYTDAVKWAAENDIVSGYGGGLYGPADDVTREQLAVIIANYIVYKGFSMPSEDKEAFEDESSISPWAVDAVKSVHSAGIVLGRPGNIYDPAGFATRAEIATMFARLLEILAR